MEAKSGIFVGLNKGFIVTKPKVNTRKQKPSYKIRKQGKRVALVREVMREVCGFAPYEKKMLELIRTGESAKEKKAVKLARRRLGSNKRALKKKEFLIDAIRAQKKRPQ
mmetsp:Transcript_2383/g.1713  ORF Transcript_2383/g.1713 Transcript_2383/m.1713 type:complete len:109 (+) Transcript_2383:45-371(+)|eukprot:CAMPEP_0202956670 /NCGR_PEP_ID=MMETSP1396-20130829/1169_1 /ASSEMBLY_ACC=CAM_ASM_000872 /TAXON_ID= /ORGANISM="Pseudokeronopsis sp., Strain Brazil" /LENGTH=108 /DNA_ID=CAMNT_0049673799 /DNA_START=44 /DNA_END=370 /DNA_ORIENTATION=-